MVFGLLAASIPSAALGIESVVTLIDLSEDNAAAHEITHDLARAIRRTKNTRYQSVNKALNVGAEDVHRTNLRSGRSLYRSALSRMRDGDFEEAAEELESAVTNYQESFAFMYDHKHIADVMVAHGVALYKSKQRQSAKKAWVRASEFRPKYEADVSKWGPKVVKEYSKARDKVLRRANVTFEVRTKPAHAEVWCNGRYFGLSPAFVRGFKGRQFVAVRKHRFARMGKVKTVKREDGAVIDFELSTARKLEVYDKLRESLAEVFGGAVERNDLSAVRGLLNASLAVIVQSSGSRHKMKIRLALANLDGRQVVKRMVKEVSWLRRDKKAMEALVLELFKAPDVPKGADGPIVKKETVFTKWWFWAGAAGVIGGSVAAYILLSGDEVLDAKYRPGTGGLALQF